MLKRKVVEDQMMEGLMIDQEVEELIRHVQEAKPDAFRKDLENAIETITNRAFMEGYQYAIEVLQESMVKEKR